MSKIKKMMIKNKIIKMRGIVVFMASNAESDNRYRLNYLNV